MNKQIAFKGLSRGLKRAGIGILAAGLMVFATGCEDLLDITDPDVVVPENLSCCGTAGDRGLIFPELSASALRREKEDLAQAGPSHCVSSNLTCETGLGAQTGASFESFLYLLEEVTRPRN